MAAAMPRCVPHELERSGQETIMKSIDQQQVLLHEVRVIDLADEKAGFCSKILADLGASVIKIEKPGGDSYRWKGPFFENLPSPETSLSFCYSNTNKQGITLDIEKDEGKEIFLRLLKKTDVVVETYPPGHLKKFGLGYDALKEINSRLILASITGFGQNGPRCQFKSCDLVASALGGQMYVSGAPSTPPLKPYGEQSFYLTSLFSAIGILLALRKRVHTGKGEHINISSQEAVASTLDHVMVRYFYDQVIAQRHGNVSWNNSSFILPCKDGHIHLSIATQWETLVEWMADEGLAEDLTEERWRDEQYRRDHVEHIIEVLQKWTRTHSTGELFETGQAMRFPWAPVCAPEDVLNSRQLKERGFFTDVDHPEFGTISGYPGTPYRFDRLAFAGRRRAPSIGEDNLRIYRDELGLSEMEIERLSSMKVI